MVSLTRQLRYAGVGMAPGFEEAEAMLGDTDEEKAGDSEGERRGAVELAGEHDERSAGERQGSP